MRSTICKESEAEVKPAPWRRSVKNPVPPAPPPPVSVAAPLEPPPEVARLRAQIAELLSSKEQECRQAYETGLRAAETARLQQAESDVRAAVQKLAEAVADVSAVRGQTIARAEADTVRLAIEIARRILHRELEMDPSALRALIKAALEKLQTQEIYRIRIHPELESVLRSCLEETGRTQPIEIIADSMQPKGGAIFEISRGALDASVSTQLREIERGLTDRLEGTR